MSDFSNSTDQEIRGTNLFMGALIFFSVVVAFAFLADTAPNMGSHPAARVAQVSIEQVS